ncbi:hypothetical protein [Legionella fallonii]|uniref:Uncharacterized protein n=1 Tax=Legionella fallonii LLAP-10 TaxID=1212491 RepID=A0A098G1L7_9GAMM|nr:hypothetical protein [Legionella fallonii]CEG56362.1 conserved protein of unknown function [Legionella fallonii LLAP-10]
MLTREHIQKIIKECREIGNDGLDNGIHASIPDLNVDIVTPPIDFLGAGGNPAVFVNKNTFKLLGSLHRDWIVDRTIALKISLFNQAPIQIIGAIVHETGHAFNVAAQIDNTETNAYIFEIEAILHLLKSGYLLSYGCTETDVYFYFDSRLSYYRQGVHESKYLASLMEKIKVSPKPEPEASPLPSISLVSTPIIASTNVSTPQRNTLFAQKLIKTSLPKDSPFSDCEEFINAGKTLTAPFIRSKL